MVRLRLYIPRSSNRPRCRAAMEVHAVCQPSARTEPLCSCCIRGRAAGSGWTARGNLFQQQHGESPLPVSPVELPRPTLLCRLLLLMNLAALKTTTGDGASRCTRPVWWARSVVPAAGCRTTALEADTPSMLRRLRRKCSLGVLPKNTQHTVKVSCRMRLWLESICYSGETPSDRDRAYGQYIAAEIVIRLFVSVQLGVTFGWTCLSMYNPTVRGW